MRIEIRTVEPESFFAGEWPDEVLAGDVAFCRRVEFAPRVFSRSVCLAPYIGGSDAPQGEIWAVHEAELETTFGSEENDMWRFNVSDRTLHSVYLCLPFDTVLGPDDAIGRWTAVSRVEGLPRLDRPSSFCMAEPKYRCVSSDGQTLLAVTEAGRHEVVSDRWRLSISDDIDLLFAGARYCGWMITRPAAYLVADRVKHLPGPQDVDSVVVDIFRRYLLLVDEDAMDAIEDGDPGVVARLRTLRDELGDVADDGGPRDALREELESLLRWANHIT